MTHDDDVLPDRQGAAAAATGDDETEAEVAAAAAERATDGNAARSEERRCSAEQQEAAAIVEQIDECEATRAASEGPIDDGRTSLMTERRRGGCTYVPMSVRMSTSSNTNGRNDPIEACPPIIQ